MSTETLSTIKIWPGSERGHNQMGWLDAKHTFSFGHFFDRNRMGFRSLRVLNDDRIAPGGGFGTHPHNDMEIVTYILRGQLQHRDSTGSSAILKPGDVQAMTAGHGIEHSEINPSGEDTTHLLQIWIIPDKAGHEPAHAEARFDRESKLNRWQPIASGQGASGALAIHQDATIFATILEPDKNLAAHVSEGRFGFFFVARGSAVVNGHVLSEGDSGEVSPGSATFTAQDEAEILFFDLN